MENRVDRKLLRELRGRINTIKLDSLTMNQESLAECIYERKWVNPFPKFKFTERPDAASAAILEGNIVVLVDNSPQAMIVPTSVFDIVEEADDYYFPPVTGSYLRLTRFLIAIITLLFFCCSRTLSGFRNGWPLSRLRSRSTCPLSGSS